MEKNRRLIQSISRASDILTIFVNERKPLGITEFANRLHLPKTTIQSIVQTLEALGYLEKDPSLQKYRLGPMVFQLGMKYATNMDLVTIGRVWAERLCFQFRQPVNIGMLVGDRVVIVMRVEPENRFMTYPQAGSVIPIHTTCIGKMLFAFLERSKADPILDNYTFDRLTPNSITDPEEFSRELAKVREEKISYDNQESVSGLAGIGGPIFNHTGQVIAAFALTGDTEVIDKGSEAIVNAVKDTSIQISMQLGCDHSLLNGLHSR